MAIYGEISGVALEPYVWARGYFVTSSGNVTDEVIREYTRLQETGEPADGAANLRVVRFKGLAFRRG